MATTDQLTAWLAEAETAYHDLQIGKSAVEFRDQNGETVRYTAASALRLAAYITDLKRQLGQLNCPGPMRAWF